MAYLALYRRFRPSTLDEVVRQEHIVTVLKNQIETGRIGHAYLFCGPRGTGKNEYRQNFRRRHQLRASRKRFSLRKVRGLPRPCGAFQSRYFRDRRGFQ